MTNTKRHYLPYAPTDESDIYPELDGTPLAETERHLRAIFRMLDMLETYFSEIDDVYVWSNMMMYYEKGNPRAYVKPDIFVSHGIGKHERRIYKVWEEGKPPDFIMEFASKSTYGNDLGGKKDIYANMGVTEYFLYDPYRTCLPTPLMGFRLVDGYYVEIPPQNDVQVTSETLNLEFVLQDDGIGVYIPMKQEWLKTRAEKEADARLKVEAEVAELRKQLRRLEEETTKYRTAIENRQTSHN